MSKAHQSHSPQQPKHPNRHWTEYTLAISGIVIAAISLWVAVDTDYTNRQLVMGASWPFLQIYNSDHGAQGQLSVSLDVANAGIGPAKIETLELFWKGKSYRSSLQFLKDCCGYKEPIGGARSGKIASPSPLGTSEVAQKVLRAGETVPIIQYALTPDDAATWNAFNAHRDEVRYRVCYCSVFNECWLSSGEDLNPPRVKSCPTPPVPYDE